MEGPFPPRPGRAAVAPFHPTVGSTAAAPGPPHLSLVWQCLQQKQALWKTDLSATSRSMG